MREKSSCMKFVKSGLIFPFAEKLSEYLKFLRYPVICSEVLLAFRVILLKFSPPHVLAFWPAIVTELVRTCTHMHAQSY